FRGAQCDFGGLGIHCGKDPCRGYQVGKFVVFHNRLQGTGYRLQGKTAIRISARCLHGLAIKNSLESLESPESPPTEIARRLSSLSGLFFVPCTLCLPQDYSGGRAVAILDLQWKANYFIIAGLDIAQIEPLNDNCAGI